MARGVDKPLAKFSDSEKISALPSENALGIDLPIGGVPDQMMVSDRRYFRARAEFARLALHCENGNLRARQIFEDCFRHELERPPGVVLEYEQAVIRTNALYFSLQGRGYLARDSVRDNRDPLLRFQSKTNIDRVARTR